jgi:hypothetical protein
MIMKTPLEIKTLARNAYAQIAQQNPSLTADSCCGSDCTDCGNDCNCCDSGCCNC